MRQLIIFFLSILFILRLQGQEHYNFIHYPAASGIISYQVNTTVQDEKGYMWLGTTNGLQRFDGVRFKTFRHIESNPLSIPSNTVWQILIDKKNNLWILFADGKAGIFDTHNFTFRETPVKFKKAVSPNTMLKRLITDEQGNVFYIISGSEVITYNEKANAFSHDFNFFKQKADWQISDFIQQPGTSKYWMAIVNGGIAIYNKASGTLSHNGNNTEKEHAIDSFHKTTTYNHLFFDNQNRVWSVSAGTYSLINCYSLLIDEFMLKNVSLYPQVKSDFDVKNFMQQKDGTVWVNGMLLMAHFLEGEKKFQVVYNGYQDEHSISYEMVHCLYEDREQNMWVCTDNNGLYRFNPSKEFFTNVNHTNRITGKKGDGNVLSFIYTKSNNLLVGTKNDGLYQYDKNFNEVPVNIRGIDNNRALSIWCMIASKDSNTIWMGSEPGIFAVDQLQRTSKYLNPPVLSGSTVRQLVEDKSGKLWIGTQSKGLFTAKVNTQNNSLDNIMAVTAIPTEQINKLTIDDRGHVWVGTPENGLYVLDAETGNLIMHFGDGEEKERKIPERGISSVLQYSDSVMLITTATRLVKYNSQTKTISLIGGPNFISGFITAMEKDNKGYVWVTSTNGLYQVDLYKNIFILYDRTDGLGNEHFVQSASYKLPDGKIAFGATHNFVSFMPGIKGEESRTQVKITDIKLKNKPLNTDSVLSIKTLTLRYDDNPLVIEFSPFLFSSISMVKYKIEGLDKDWNQADRTYQAVYNYLPPGDYDFLIKPSDYMGNELPTVIMLKIKVESPFWKTWWFYCLMTLLAGALLYWLDQQRMARKEALHKMRSDIADDLHQEVNTALGNINILSEMARLKADTEPQKSKEFIEQIHTRSHNMINAMDDMLWSISPDNDSMEKTISRLKETLQSLKSRYNVQIDLLVDEKVKSLQLNMKQRKDVFWFFKSGITNVVRTGGQGCLIHIAYEKPNLLYTLEFDTTSTNIQQLNNLRQRQELKDKLAAIHATLEVKDLKSKTIFLLRIPVHS